jgi:peptidoglycan/xylan/chitin deacetylase (PgdA/CDA1 family)
VKRGIEAVLSRSPAQPLFVWRASRRLAVLAYHAVDEPERLAAHLDLLRRAWHPVSMDDVLAAVGGRVGLPRRAVLITFDDADRTVLERGLPLLRERGLAGVAFVVTGLVGGDRPVWTRETRELSAAGGSASAFPEAGGETLVSMLKRAPDAVRLEALEELRRSAPRRPAPVPQLEAGDLPALESGGIAVESHSASHACLPRCPQEKVVAEILDAHRDLERVLGSAPRAFAYPNGDRDHRAARELRALGYRAAFGFDHRHSPVPPEDPLAIPRLRINASDPLDRFRIVLSGLHPAILHLRNRLRLAGATDRAGDPVRAS